jgi:hypothetical protein
MKLPQIIADQVSVVFRGSFEPNVVTPAWMYINGLIGRTELAESEVHIISSEIARFEAGWLICEITRDALKVKTADNSEFERTRDAAIGILRASPGVSVGALGINRETDFSIDSNIELHRIGDRVAPKEIWSDVLKFPGMRDVTMWGVRSDHYSGRIQVQVQPSNRVSTGVFVAYNDHFSLNSADSRPNSREEAWPSLSAEVMEPSVAKVPLATEILGGEWGSSMERAEAVLMQIFELRRA